MLVFIHVFHRSQVLSWHSSFKGLTPNSDTIFQSLVSSDQYLVPMSQDDKNDKCQL